MNWSLTIVHIAQIRMAWFGIGVLSLMMAELLCKLAMDREKGRPASFWALSAAGLFVACCTIVFAVAGLGGVVFLGLKSL